MRPKASEVSTRGVKEKTPNESGFVKLEKIAAFYG